MKMSKEKIDISMFAPCGMNCKVCYKHCYNKKPCSGCLNSDKGKPEHCRKCKIKDCIKGKSLSYCFECAEYPCKLIKNLEKSYNKRYQASLIENSRFVQGHGLEHFMEQQKIKYTCPKCGGIISKLATTSSTGGLLLALQRAIVTIRPKGRYRKHFCWPAIKRYYSNLLVSILLLALLYTFELLHLLYCQSFQHNIL